MHFWASWQMASYRPLATAANGTWGVAYIYVNALDLMHGLLPRYGAFDLGLAVSVPLPIVTGIFVLLWFQSRLT